MSFKMLFLIMSIYTYMTVNHSIHVNEVLTSITCDPFPINTFRAPTFGHYCCITSVDVL